MRKITPTPLPAPRVLEPKTIGAAVRASRTRMGMRQIDAASLCRVALQTYVDIEKGSAGTSIGLVLQVADEMGVQIFAFACESRERMQKIARSEGWSV